MTATTDLRTFACAAPESDELLSFCRGIFVNRLFAPLAGQPGLKLGGLQGSDSVSTRHPPLIPLPDPIPLKIQFPASDAFPIAVPPKYLLRDRDGVYRQVTFGAEAMLLGNDESAMTGISVLS